MAQPQPGHRISTLSGRFRTASPAGHFVAGDVGFRAGGPGAPRTYSTNFALGTPGNAASYRVYVILTRLR